jgi:hypothetical protein
VLIVEGVRKDEEGRDAWRDEGKEKRGGLI